MAPTAARPSLGGLGQLPCLQPCFANPLGALPSDLSMSLPRPV